MHSSVTFMCGYKSNGFNPYYTINNLIINSLDFKTLDINMKDKNTNTYKREFTFTSNHFINNNRIILKPDNDKYPYFNLLINNEIIYSQKYALDYEVKIIFNNPKNDKEINTMFKIESLTGCDK